MQAIYRHHGLIAPHPGAGALARLVLEPRQAALEIGGLDGAALQLEYARGGHGLLRRDLAFGHGPRRRAAARRARSPDCARRAAARRDCRRRLSGTGWGWGWERGGRSTWVPRG